MPSALGRRLYKDNRAQIAAGADPACLPIKEVASFRSEIVALKTVKAGERADTASNTERLNDGDRDGLRRLQRRCAEIVCRKKCAVLVGERRSFLFGVCMDQRCSMCRCRCK
jgi:alanine racemase